MMILHDVVKFMYEIEGTYEIEGSESGSFAGITCVGNGPLREVLRLLEPQPLFRMCIGRNLRL